MKCVFTTGYRHPGESGGPEPRRKQFQFVLRGLDPRIHVFAPTVARRGWPGPTPPRRKLGGEFLDLAPLDFSTGSPALPRGLRQRAVHHRQSLIYFCTLSVLGWTTHP